MSVSTIDGTIVEAKLGRGGSKAAHASLAIVEPGGARHDFTKMVVPAAMFGHMKAGTSGRFYLFNTVGQRGIHGLRLNDGTAINVHPSEQNLTIAKFAVFGGVAGIGVGLFANGLVSLIALLALALGVVGCIVTTKSLNETRAQFDADEACAGFVNS